MRRTLAWTAAVIVVVACEPAGHGSASPTLSPAATSNPQGQSSPSLSQQTSNATPARLAGKPVGTVDFSCRLPVLIQDQPLYGWTGGFIRFPGGIFQADPAGVIDSGEGLITEAQPQLSGADSGAPFYDLARKRWLPVGPNLASPDGSSYAYVFGAHGLPAEYYVDVVTVATGATRSWTISPPQPGSGYEWVARDYDGRYVYIVAAQVDQSSAGVWRFDSRTGIMQQLLPTTAGHVLLVREGVVWVGINNTADPSPPKPPNGVGFDSIESINLSTGAHTTWIYRKAQSMIFWGLDSASHPVVMVTSPPNFASVLPLLLIDSPGANGIDIPAGFLPQGTMEADGARLWFGGPDGLYYWTLAAGLRKVYDFESAPSPATSPFPEMMIPAGHCV